MERLRWTAGVPHRQRDAGGTPSRTRDPFRAPQRRGPRPPGASRRPGARQREGIASLAERLARRSAEREPLRARLAAAALPKTLSMAEIAELLAAVSGDLDLTELDDPQPPVLTPATVLDRWDPVPRRLFQAGRGTIQVVLSGPKRGERRVHRALQAASYVTQRTSGTEEHPNLAWVQAPSHSGDHPPEGFQRGRLERAQSVGTDEGYQLRQHGMVIAGPSQFRVVRHRASGEELFRLFADDPDRALRQLARQLGLPTEDLVLEKAPGSWDLPGATN